MNVMTVGFAHPKAVKKFADVITCFRFLEPHEEVGQNTWDELRNTIKFYDDSYMTRLKCLYRQRAEEEGKPCPKPYPSLWLTIFIQVKSKLYCLKYLVRDLVELSIDTNGFTVGGQSFGSKIEGMLYIVQDIFSRAMVFDQPGKITIDPSCSYVKVKTEMAFDGESSINIAYSEMLPLNKESMRLAMWMTAGDSINVRMCTELKNFMDTMTPDTIMEMIENAKHIPTHAYGKRINIRFVHANVVEMFKKSNQEVQVINDEIIFLEKRTEPFRFGDDDLLKHITTAKLVKFAFNDK